MSGPAQSVAAPRTRAGAEALDLRVPLLAFAASRAIVIVTAVVAGLLLGVPQYGIDPSVPSPLALLGAWDTTWYLDIARYGYSYDYGQVGVVHTNLAFFPGLPMLMAGALSLGLNPFAVALVAANGAFFGALVGIHALTREIWDERVAERATWCLALFPPAIFASLAYTEGITLALAVWAAYAAWRGRLVVAGLCAMGAAMMRPTGILVVLLVALIVAREPRPDRVWRAALTSLPAVGAVAAFLAWMQIARGSATLPFEAQAAWNRGALGLEMVWRLGGEVGHLLVSLGEWRVTLFWTAQLRDILFAAVYLVLLVMLWRRFGGLRSPWVLYSLAMLAIPLSSGTFLSLARMGLLAFPLVWPLAEWVGRSPRRVRPAVAVAVAVILLGVVQIALRSP